MKPTGPNPRKRKFTREARDLWYEICAKRYASDPDRLNEISEKLGHAVTKDDLEGAVVKIVQLVRTEAANEQRPIRDRVQEVARLGQ